MIYQTFLMIYIILHHHIACGALKLNLSRKRKIFKKFVTFFFVNDPPKIVTLSSNYKLLYIINLLIFIIITFSSNHTSLLNSMLVVSEILHQNYERIWSWIAAYARVMQYRYKV